MLIVFKFPNHEKKKKKKLMLMNKYFSNKFNSKLPDSYENASGSNTLFVIKPN